VPDTRPLSVSDLSADRRHDEMFATARGYGFGSGTASVADLNLPYSV